MARNPRGPVTTTVQQQSTKLSPEFAPTGRLFAAESLHADLSEVVMGTITGPARFSGHYRAGDHHADSSAGDRCPQAEPCFTSWALSDALAQTDQVHPDCFSGDIRRGAGPDATVLAGRPVMPCSIVRHGVQPAGPFGTGKRLRRWPRPFPCSEGVFEGSAGDATSKAVGPTPYCRGADGRAGCAPALREFLAQEFHARPWVPTHAPLMGDVARRKPCAGPGNREFPVVFESRPFLVDKPGGDLHTRGPVVSAGWPTGARVARRAAARPCGCVERTAR